MIESLVRFADMAGLTPRETFNRHLQSLMDDVLALGSRAEQAIGASVDALNRHDLEASRRIYAADQQINEKRYLIESSVITLIATQQPMARDLRLLAAVLEIITELERIADYAKGISKINLLIGSESVIDAAPELSRMAELGCGLLNRSLVAFLNRDAEEARRIPNEDKVVDDLYNKVFRTMLNVMITSPGSIDQANYIIWAAHNLERMSDRVTNICERTLFAVNGEILELDQPPEENDLTGTGWHK